MNEIVNVNGKAVERIIYKDIPVVTLGMVDDLHERATGTARRNFNENKLRFVEREDYFVVPKDEWQATSVRNSSAGRGYAGDMIFLTETGYLMLCKSLTDDLSWAVQRQLVKCYFQARSLALQTTNQLPMQTKVSVSTTDLVKEANKGNRFAQRLLHHLTGMQVDDIAAEIEHKQVVEDFKRAELAANYLDLLIDAPVEQWGIIKGVSDDGLCYVQGLPTQLYNAFRNLGKDHGLPMLAKGVESFGAILAKEAAGLEFYGWRRSVAKRTNGSRHFRFERVPNN